MRPDELRFWFYLASTLLALNLWWLRRLIASHDTFKSEVRKLFYGDADTTGLLTRMQLVEEVLRMRRRERETQ